MMYQQIKQLEIDGVPLSQIVYVNFEDERLLEMTADDLNMILEIGLEISGVDHKTYLFFDEIQNIDGWEKFVRRVADMKYRVNITSSNSKMLRREMNIMFMFTRAGAPAPALSYHLTIPF